MVIMVITPSVSSFIIQSNNYGNNVDVNVQSNYVNDVDVDDDIMMLSFPLACVIQEIKVQWFSVRQYRARHDFSHKQNV